MTDDIKKEQIGVERLTLGMYVTELDRPWAGTPFMLQGFLLDDQNDLDTMQTLCKFVFIDRSRSIGDHFAANAKLNVAIKREGSVFRIKDPGAAKSDTKTNAAAVQNKLSEKSSFVDILRDLKNYQAPQNVERTNQDGMMYNVKHGANTSAQATLPDASQRQKVETPSITQQLAADVGGFIGGLFKRNKLKSNTDPVGDNKKK